MIQRIWAAYLVEWSKVLRLKRMYLSLLLVAMAILCSPLLRPIEQDGVGDYGFIAYVTPLSMNVLGFFLVLAFSGGLISTEMTSGTIRMILTRPIHRWEWVMAKVMLGLTFAITMMVLVSVLSWGLVLVLGDLTGVTFGGEIRSSHGEMVTAYLLGLGLSFGPMAAGVAYALAISSITKSPIASVMAAVGLWLAVDFLKNPLGIEAFVFTSYLEMPWQQFANRCDGIGVEDSALLVPLLLTSAATFVAGVLIAMMSIGRRDFSR